MNKNTQLYAAYKRLISLKTHKFKVKKWKKILHAGGNQKRAGVAVFILISDKIDIKPKAVTREKEDHYIIIKGTVHQYDITVVNICTPNIGAFKCIKQLLNISERRNRKQNNNNKGLQYHTLTNGGITPG